LNGLPRGAKHIPPGLAFQMQAVKPRIRHAASGAVKNGRRMQFQPIS
jgi:hypothetical protein